MRKLLLILLLLPFATYAQQTGSPAAGGYVVKPQTTSYIKGSTDTAKLRLYFGSNQFFDVPTMRQFANKQNQFITNVADLGATTGGDNLTIINNAIASLSGNAYAYIYIPDGDYPVSAIPTNPLGRVKYTGPGRIVKFETYGRSLINSTADDNQNIFGSVYLGAVRKAVINGQPVIFIYSGDSTTAGDATTTGFTISELMKYMCDINGINQVTHINRGHSGQSSVHWKATFLQEDLITLAANNGNLYIPRWGINDPTLGRTAAQVIVTVDSCLAIIRSNGNFTLDRLSILLMNCSPTTNDQYNHQSDLYYEELDRGYRLLARKYQCAYINTYAIFRGVERNAIGFDTPIPTDTTVHIHPLNNTNTAIASVIFDLVFPQYFRKKTHNSPETKLNSDVPSTYLDGVSQHFVTTANGFPVTGNLTTHVQILAKVATQVLTTYENAQATYIRGGFGGAWQPWQKVNDNTYTDTQIGLETLQRVTDRGSTTNNTITISAPTTDADRYINIIKAGINKRFGIAINNHFVIGENSGGDGLVIQPFSGVTTHFGKFAYNTHPTYGLGDSLVVADKKYVDQAIAGLPVSHIDAAGNEVLTNRIISKCGGANGGNMFEKTPNGSWYWVRTDDDGGRLTDLVIVTIGTQGESIVTLAAAPFTILSCTL